MGGLPLVTTAVVTAGVARQMFVLSGVVRSGRFLRQGRARVPSHSDGLVMPRFFLVVPVLREAAILAEAVAHFQNLACGYAATVIVVTTAREIAENTGTAAAGETIPLARELARESGCVHLHYPDPHGLKADQLNYATARCAAMLPGEVPSSQAFLVCYDADSRPPADSLAHFTHAIADHPHADVFHQSSRFELRPRQVPHAGTLGGLRAAICDAGGLRANRFVLGFEIPRLLNGSDHVSALKRKLCAGVYAHVTSHGLCVRLSRLQHLPFPAGSPLEDMHYSFILGSRGLPMIAVASLDVAEVPSTLSAQVQQAARWFFGPARFAQYLKDPATLPGCRAKLMAASALGSAGEWVGCAVVPIMICVLIVVGGLAIRIAATCYAALCAAQVILAEAWMGTPSRLSVRLRRVGAFPLACLVHGAGGVLGWARLLAGGTGTGKTERGPGA
jgi:hypothetical protein